MRGFANATQDFLLEPEGFSVLMERMVGFGCALMRAAVRHGFHGIRFADDWGTHLGLMISPALWRELFKPRYARQFALAHALGLHPWHHCGGEFLAIMEDFSEIGVEVLNITSLAAALTRRGVRLTSPGIRSKLAASKGFPVQKQILRIRRDKAGL
ncbi:MAG: hypothetical protein MUF81_11615, partial [Verrucomicrobia bacterium]|nr:hypothetical protein [Verrucomicrobiota bacterium]